MCYNVHLFERGKMNLSYDCSPLNLSPVAWAFEDFSVKNSQERNRECLIEVRLSFHAAFSCILKNFDTLVNEAMIGRIFFLHLVNFIPCKILVTLTKIDEFLPFAHIVQETILTIYDWLVPTVGNKLSDKVVNL